MPEFELDKRIRSVILWSKLTQKDFGLKIKMSYTTVNEIMNNKKGAGINVVLGILNAFDDVSPDWLLLGKGEMLRSLNVESCESKKLTEENRRLKDENYEMSKELNRLYKTLSQTGSPPVSNHRNTG